MSDSALAAGVQIAASASPPACRVAHAWITQGMYELLELEAGRRGIHPDRFCADIIEHTLLKITPRRLAQSVLIR